MEMNVISYLQFSSVSRISVRKRSLVIGEIALSLFNSCPVGHDAYWDFDRNLRGHTQWYRSLVEVHLSVGSNVRIQNGGEDFAVNNCL